MTRLPVDYYVMDALANDIESIEHLLHLTNHPDMGWRTEHGGPITREDVVPSLLRLIRDGLVRSYIPSASEPELEECALGVTPTSNWDDCYFGLSAHGKVVHASWEPSDS
jgi:hypothetical protein